jgi:hypothetical protein
MDQCNFNEHEGARKLVFAPGALVIRCCLCIICPSKLPVFVKISDESKGGTISLPEGYLRLAVWPYERKRTLLTDVANDPVLQTVNTFRPSPEPPPPFTS